MIICWNLQNLFKDKEQCLKEMEKVKKLLSEIKRFETMQLNSDTLLELLNQNWDIRERTNHILVYGSLLYYKDISSVDAVEFKNQVEQFDNKVQTELGFVNKKLIELGKNAVYFMTKENVKLEGYSQSIKNIFRMDKHIQNHETNIQIEKNKNAIQDQITKYNELLKNIKFGTINIEEQEIEITPSNFTKYISDENREIRRQTYCVVNKAFFKYGKDFASILDNIYQKRNENSNLENYDSTLEKILKEDDVNHEIITHLINSVHKHIDLLQRYIKLKLKKINIKDPKFYDIRIPFAKEVCKKYTIEDAVEIIKNALKPLGNQYLEKVQFLLNGYIDAMPEENKHQLITFSWNSYAFMNFRGNYVDLRNLIHEIGHITNYQMSKEKQEFLYEDSTIFIGEIVSKVNELLLSRYLYQTAETKQEKIFYLSKEIEIFVTELFSQIMYTEFEKKMYELKEKNTLTQELLSEQYRQILKLYYGDLIKLDDNANMEWAKNGHLYRWSFYVYKYASGILIASNIVDELLKEGSFMKESFLNFISAGSSLSTTDMLKLLHIDLMKSLKNGFKLLEEDINRLEEILMLED